MLELLYFILCTYGMTFMIVYGSIFNKIRPKKDSGFFGKLFNCPLCTGFHAGWFILVLSKYTSLFTFELNVVNAFLLSCLSAGTSYLISSIVKDNGIQISKE